MKFKVDSFTRCAARLGLITDLERLPELTFETPLVLLYTRRGCIPHLTKDVVKMLTKEDQFLTMSLPSTILMSNSIGQSESFAKFVSMNEYPFFLTIQDPTECIKPQAYSKTKISVWSRNGRSTVTPEKYMDIVEVFKPDMYMNLCDGNTSVTSSSKRISKAVEKSKTMLEKCLSRHLESEVLKKKGFFGAVEGGYDLQARETCINYLKDKPLTGYVIDGLHKSGKDVENIQIENVKYVVEHSLNLLPTDKLRVLMGNWNPATLLDLVDLGIDIFDSSYPTFMTEESKALVFLCNSNCNHEANEIDLVNKKYVDKFEPICKCCKCLSCQNHTKAYIHHLIQTKELLSLVLLTIHNMHQYLEFFNLIRYHIKNNSFKDFKTKIHSKYHRNVSNRL